MLAGGCFCGAVRYQVTAEPFHSTLCHCSDCRRMTGAPVAWFTVPVSGFQFTAGAPRGFRSSPKVERQFCGDCGTGLTFQHADLPQEIDITTCSLDMPEQMAPKDHTFTRSRLAWMRLADGMPEYEIARR